jgi:hypothetical protein
MKPPNGSNGNIRQWLIENGYQDVADSIEKVMDGWRRKGTKTRRNWWEVLAGNADGSGKTIEGVKFPVLRAARIRQNLEVAASCLCRNKREKVPPIVEQVRWTSKGK